MYSPGTNVGGDQARSVVVTTGGVVASESPLASQAGAVILAQGGNAVDAAVAVNAVMGVVAPHSNGIGGDLFALYYKASEGRYYGLNASGWSPKHMNFAAMKERGHSEVPRKGILSVSIPGAVDGWHRLLMRFGRFGLGRLLEPAIHLAEKGFPVTERSAARWHENQHELTGHAREALLPLSSTAPRFGEIFRNVALAENLRKIGRHGSDAFYRGEIAERIVALSRQENGLLERDDFAEYTSTWVEPLTTSYRGWTLFELPPNGTGIAALVMLNIAENFPLGEYGANSADALHVLIEAKKLAYADMVHCVCDPAYKSIPLDRVLSKQYAAERAALISMSQAMEKAALGYAFSTEGDTVYLSVADREGNIISLIQSNYMNFGSGLVAEGTGFVLQNRANLFSADPGHPNALGGHKRPLHTILPAFLTKEDRRIAFGIQGGWNQPLAHVQFVSNIVDHGMNIQAALEAPRFTKLTFDGVDVQMESRISLETRDNLRQRGHLIKVEAAYSEAMGGGQATMHETLTTVNFGASDPRKDGAAIPEPIVPLSSMSY